MQILDPSFNAIATTGPTGTEIVDALFTGSSPVPTVYTSTGSFSPPITGTASAVVVPECGSLPLLALGGVWLSATLLQARYGTRKSSVSSMRPHTER
jgi:hypothetical protein